MGLFDSLKRGAESAIKREASKAISNAASKAANSVGKGKNTSERFTFSIIPENTAQLQSIPEASLDSPFKTAALTLLVLCNFKKSPDAVFEMLDFLKGPENVSVYEKQFITERLKDKEYKTFSFFEGSSTQNNYTPTMPYTIEVFENPYSFDNENWATLWVKSSGADNLRSIKFRKKPSTGQWFLNEIQCLSDIRVPAEADPWA